MKGEKEKYVVLRTALVQIRYRRSTSILIGITIMLTSALIMMIGSCAYGLVRQQQYSLKETYGDFHGDYARTNAETYERIREHPGFETAGGSQRIAQAEYEEIMGVLYAMDDSALTMLKSFPLLEGKLPERSDEIVAPAYFLQQMGYKGVVGERISLRYRVLGKGEYIEQEFVVSGLTGVTEWGVMAGNFACLVSEEYADSVITPADRIRTVYFKLADEQNYDMETIRTEILRLTRELGINEADLQLNTMYMTFLISPNIEVIIVVIVLILMVVFFSVLVIYNIFYVGLVGRIQDFGKLRGLGAGKRQLKGMIFLEGILLGGIAVPLGIIVGGFLSQIGFNLILGYMQLLSGSIWINTWNPVIILMTAAVTFFTIWQSLRKPMRMVVRVSPVQAIRHINSSGLAKDRRSKKAAGSKEHRRPVKKDHGTISLFRLTAANLTRNKQRTITTILTLGLSSVLFIVVANVGSSMSVEDMTRRSLEKGDFRISLDYETDDQTYPENNLYAQQERGLLGDALVNEIKAIPGVTKVEIRKGVLVRTTILQEEFTVVLSAFSREDWAAYQSEFISGEADYDTIVDRGGIVYTWATEDRVSLLEYETGDAVPMVMMHGQDAIPMQLSLSSLNTSLLSLLMMPEEGFERLGLQGNTNYELFVSCEPDASDAVESALKELIAGDEAYEMISYREEREIAVFSIQLTVLPVYGLLIAMGVIGFMNMANTLITSIITRKQELGVLQAIGLTNRQMAHMLQMEGLVFTVGTLLLALTIGNGLGYAAFVWARDNFIMAIGQYHFPVVETVIFTGVLLFLQLILSWLCSRSVRKEGIIDRMRHPE